MAKRRSSEDPDAPAPDPSPKSDRPRYLAPRTEDTRCRIHHVALDATGYCPAAEAWWVPKFACPHCASRLWDNGYCPSCTPRTRTFPGDYFEARWDAVAGREWGHFVRVASGPTAAPPRAEVDGFLAELRAHSVTVGRAVGQVPTPKQPGDEANLPAWVTESADA